MPRREHAIVARNAVMRADAARPASALIRRHPLITGVPTHEGVGGGPQDRKRMLRSRLSPRHLKLMELLVAERKRAGLLQAALCDRLRRPQSYVSKYESGDRRLDLVELLEVIEGIGCDHEPLIAAVKAVDPGR